MIPKKSGFDILAEFFNKVKIIIQTGHVCDPEEMIKLEKADQVLFKPFSLKMLLDTNEGEPND